MVTESAKRLALQQWAKDRLWSESGGHCQNPECRADLHSHLERKHIGELAHIIPASPKGPRAEEKPELDYRKRNLPENVLLLCPTCHTMIDKEPQAYQANVLQDWKRISQEARAEAYGTPKFASRSEARRYTERLLSANQAVFRLYGPLDDVFDDDRAEQWSRHLKGTIIPNSQQLLRVFRANWTLLDDVEKSTVDEYAIHVKELTERHIKGDWTPGSTRYPTAVDAIFRVSK